MGLLIRYRTAKIFPKKQVIEEILPAWHEINSLYYFTKVNNQLFELGTNDTGPDLISGSTKEYIECKLVENPTNSNYVCGFPKITLNQIAKSEFIDTDKLALTFTNRPPRINIIKNNSAEISISEFKFENLPFARIYLNVRCPFNIPNNSDFYLFKKEEY